LANEDVRFTGLLNKTDVKDSLTFIMTILYVDDDADDRQIFKEALAGIDPHHLCVTARDGLDALSRLAEGPLPDVIFLDINMPLMDGKTCLRELRSHRQTANIPIVMFTTSHNPEEKEICQKLGATDFQFKPVSYKEMKNMLVTILLSLRFTLTH